MLVDLAGALVDRLGAVLVERLPGERGDLASEPLAVDADERRQAFVRARESRVFERVEPRFDARLDRVDERAIEVEEDGFGQGQGVDVGGVSGHDPTVAGPERCGRSRGRGATASNGVTAAPVPPSHHGRIDTGGRLWLLVGHSLAGSTRGDGNGHDSSDSKRNRAGNRP